MLERKNASTDNPVDATRKAAFFPLNRYSERFTNKDYYFDRMVVLIFCFMGFIGSFFGAFLKNKPVGQLKNAIAEFFRGGAFSLPTIFRWIYG